MAQNLTMARYTFGDDQPAVERLRLVADAYEPVSRAFLQAEAPEPAGTALDLGCGPAFSTQLLIEACSPAQAIGIDASDDFIDVARARLPEVTFVTHDVTRMPLPGAPADVIYARLLLAHLPEPANTAQRWLTQLSSGGVLLLEDLEEVVAPPGPLREYEQLSAETVRRGGGVMYAGADLARFGGRCQPVTVPGALAARIYRVNVHHWQAAGDPSVRDDLNELDEGLARVIEDDGGKAVSWIVRQVAVRT